MKFKLPMGVCVLIAIVLVLFGLGYGTFSGFREDRQQVTQLLSGENGLLDALSYQGADGLNLCVVADRHLPGNADVEALRQVSRKLNAGDETLEEPDGKRAFRYIQQRRGGFQPQADHNAGRQVGRAAGRQPLRVV